MVFISESIIDGAVDYLSASDQHYEQAFAQMSEEQPALISYLFAESHSVFSESERSYLLYLTIVIWYAIKSEESNLNVSVERLATAEERNWELLEQSGTKNKDLRSKLDIFFENYQQEDLLAFIEDLMNDEEATEISPESVEPFIVILKSIVDAIYDL